MKLHTIKAEDIVVAKNRQRRAFDPEDLIKLASSISKNGLISPVVVRQDGDNCVLVAGERRIKAMQYIWDLFEGEVKCGEFTFGEGLVPCLYQGEMDPIDAFEMELEENIRRVDLSWQERAEATAQLMDLRKTQSERSGEAPPTIEDISSEVRGSSPTSVATTRQELLVAKYLADPDVNKAKTVNDAFKILKRKEETRRSEDLAASVGVTFTSAVHTLRQGDCFEVMSEIPDGTFDIILTDPPYGIDADSFGDSGGIAQGSHFYDDSWTTWNNLAKRLAVESFRITKPQAHFYGFCDVDNFVLFKSYMQSAGWKVFRTPIIWVNPTAARAPWPEMGPQRKYQIALYAVKGNKPVARLFPDVITCQSDDNLGHQAQKPVGLYTDLLARSAVAGDLVLDPFGGSGTIIPACHALKCYATYIELDQAAYGIAVARLKEIE